MNLERQKKDLILRLKRIEGQVRGIERMIEKEVPCPEIMTQVAAATAAMKKVGTTMVQTYMEECLGKTEKDPQATREERLRDLQKAISLYIDRA